MPLPVSLQAVADALDMTGDEITQYIDRKTGELVMVSDEELGYAEDQDDGEAGLSMPDWQREAVEDARRVLASDDFVPLPDQHQIHEWDIMRRFCEGLEDQRVRDALLGAIQGRGAFRSFKDRAHEEGVTDDWYRFRNRVFCEIAAEFLTAEGIPFDPQKPAWPAPGEDR